MQRYWLLFEKSPEHVSTPNIEAYDDITGQLYSYDNSVPNHKSLSANDYVVIRKNNTIVGSAIVDKISSKPGKKERVRCPKCNRTNVEERKSQNYWRCSSGKRSNQPCNHTFEAPIRTYDSVTKFSAHLRNFRSFEPSQVELSSVKSCAFSKNSQHSILELDQNLVERVVLLPTLTSSEIAALKNSDKADNQLGCEEPQVYYQATRQYRRCKNVIDAAIERSRGLCEFCGEKAPFTRKSDGKPFLEVHHKRPLSEGGPDTLDNVAAICPNCHRQAHYG